MNIGQGVLLGLIEGITEFLPISSTGHLMLAGTALGIGQTEFYKSFEIAIQLGAIMAVAVLFGKKILEGRDKWGKIMLAFLPTGVIGFFGYKLVKRVLLGSNVLVAVTLIIGGFIILLFEKRISGRGKKTVNELRWYEAVGIGVGQSVSMIPGVSRALATIFSGMVTGLTRVEAVEMSFWLAIPTMAAATGYDLLKSGWSFNSNEWVILFVGMGVSFISALAVVKWLLGYVQKNDFKIFGYYRIAVGILWLLLV